MQKKKNIITVNTDASFHNGFAGAAIISKQGRVETSRSLGFHCPDSQLAELTAIAIAINTYLKSSSDILINSDCYFCINVLNRIVYNIENIFSANYSGTKLPLKPVQQDIGEKNIILRGLYAYIFSMLIMQDKNIEFNLIPRTENSKADALASNTRKKYMKTQEGSNQKKRQNKTNILEIISQSYGLRKNQFYSDHIKEFHSMNDYRVFNRGYLLSKDGDSYENNSREPVNYSVAEKSVIFNSISIAINANKNRSR